MRDRLAVLEPLVSFGGSLALGIAQGVAVLPGCEQMNHGGELATELIEQAARCCMSAAIVFSKGAAPAQSMSPN
jgi:hypothetical protein